MEEEDKSELDVLLESFSIELIRIDSDLSDILGVELCRYVMYKFLQYHKFIECIKSEGYRYTGEKGFYSMLLITKVATYRDNDGVLLHCVDGNIEPYQLRRHDACTILETVIHFGNPAPISGRVLCSVADNEIHMGYLQSHIVNLGTPDDT